MQTLKLLRTMLQSRWLPLIVLLLVVVALVAAWQLTPLGRLIEPEVLAQKMRSVARSPWAPLGVAIIYVSANALLVPNAALNVGTILALGAPFGIIYALYGSLCAGVLGLLAGRYIGLDRLRALEVPGLDAIGRPLRRSGFVGVLLVRLTPVAPFSVMNMAMGALQVRVPAFLLGSLLGLLPAALTVGLIGHRVEAILRDGIEASEIGFLALILAVLVAALLLLRRWLISRLQ
jgi:uncharacterized membrane protein YdjX (TVP38/TMEM64 family)